MLAAILGILASLGKLLPTLVQFGDKLYAAWQEAREKQATAARQASLDAIDARGASDRASIADDLKAAEIERKRRWDANAQAAAQKVIDDAARARSELADAPPAPKP